LLREAQLADQLGLDEFGVGELHWESYAMSSLTVVLAAATSMINLFKHKI
jgi:alkanesulfonate monooxygenase SsuD/methylene tetrahydromethanopterin reductase-like flavin-dependent oxidoreductase (luciferase family)